MNMNYAKKIFKEILLAYFKPVKKLSLKDIVIQRDSFLFIIRKKNHKMVVQNMSVKLL